MSQSVRAIFSEKVAFAASVNQNQAAQNVQPALRSTLSTMLDITGKR